MRVLFTSWPAYGHLLPMIPLARAAQRAGHEVRIASGGDVRALIEERGFPAVVAGPTLAESYAAAGAAMAERAGGARPFSEMTPEEETELAARYLFGAAAVPRARDLLDGFESWSPDVMVHDQLELGGPAAAETAGMRHITHSYGPIVPNSDVFADAAGETLAAAGLLDPVPSMLAGTYLDICPPSLQQPTLAPWTVGTPLRPSPGEVLATDVLPHGFDRLAERPMVYLTLGTIMNQRPEVFRAALTGCARLPVSVVATTGPGFDPADLGPLPENVMAVPYLAQAQVLPHCAAVVSHTGAGTMLGALCFGLPQLCLPQGTDQPSNAAAVLRAGAGLALSPEETTADAVAEALDAVLNEARYRDAAVRVRGEIDAMPDADTVLRDLL